MMASHGVARAVVALALAACWHAGAAVPEKAARPSDFADRLKLEQGCGACFPNNQKGCAEDVWDRCCSQEITCHNFHCRGKVMGSLHKGTKVRVVHDFVSDDGDKVELTKGMTGKVLKVDEDGDAYIKFWRHELDDEFFKQWVFKTTFWVHLELPAGVVRSRASRVVSCLDDCTRDQRCRMQSLTKKQTKVFQGCMAACKPEKCRDDGECNVLLEAYAICKQETAQSAKCSPAARAEL